jgi:hypothetical protein
MLISASCHPPSDTGCTNACTHHLLHLSYFSFTRNSVNIHWQTNWLCLFCLHFYARASFQKILIGREKYPTKVICYIHTYVRGDVMNGVLTFKIFIEIPSYPREFLDFSELIIFYISSSVVYFSFVYEQGSLKIL